MTIDWIVFVEIDISKLINMSDNDRNDSDSEYDSESDDEAIRWVLGNIEKDYGETAVKDLFLILVSRDTDKLGEFLTNLFSKK